MVGVDVGHAEIEARVRAALAAGDHDLATELAVRGYGSELIGWLCSILPHESDAQEAFSVLTEKLWRSLKTFDGRCSMRTWCYMLARQAAGRVRERSHRSHELLVTSVPSVAQAVTHVWSTTRLDAEREHDVYAELRNGLDEDDQTLLVLRVDRGLAWRDIAIVMLGETADDDAITRRAAALRKQFERLKEQLRAAAAARLRE